ncbi:MAG: sulfatase [Acidobacteriia bacterium]|nr:sulfatase [Terriglobia bacterium]
MNSSNRRQFLSLTAGAGAALAADGPRPNILWITSEDNGPHLGCYGDTYATTPNLDRLASNSLRYNTAWSNAPVCAPARTTLISGLYPPCTGAEHMRSMTRLPRGFQMYPQYLREAGYYCTNNNKEDYNLAGQGQVWDESSKEAHWRRRKGAQPFFSIFNFTISHESQIRKRPHQLVHDPAKVRVPAYHPDTPEVRHDWAQYYDNLTTMDAQAGEVMRQLEQDGLAGDTIIFYYGDHGSGMPRSKRWPYNSGLQVPLLLHIPEKFRHLAPAGYKAGGSTDRLVGFIDMAPTLMSLVGMKPAAHLQGHAFAGSHIAPEQPYLYGFRGRMDERYDMVRSVRDQRFVYIRNYMPHKIYGQNIDYMFETPTTRAWKKLYDAGKLNRAQSRFWETKPAEELYDLQNDRDEVNNLAADPSHKQRLDRMRKAQQDLAVKIRDIGFLPEAEIHSRSQGSTPYEMGHDEKRYPAGKVMAAAERASMLQEDAVPDLLKAMADGDSAVRYWGAMGILMRGARAMDPARAALRKALADTAPSVRIVAAEALGRYGGAEDLQLALPVLSGLAAPDKNGVYVSLLAMNVIDILDKKAMPLKGMVETMPRRDLKAHARLGTYVDRLVEKTLADLS